MTHEPLPGTFDRDLIEEATARLQEALAVLDVIFENALLAQLPARAEAKALHQRAVSLLTMMQRDLTELTRRLEAGSLAVSVIARAAKGAGTPDRQL